jgi:endonuclease-3 related protein
MINRYQEAFNLLYAHYGDQQWWPAETKIEILVGAVLTQNTNWSNVEKALANLKEAGVLVFERLLALDETALADYIRPSGYYNLKARRLKNLLAMIHSVYEGSLDLLEADSWQSARENLLSVKGVGPETADAILLYVCEKPIFVVDSYTYRVFLRHNMVEEETDYQSIQDAFMDNLEHETNLFNEYHALIVQVAKDYCRKNNPLCSACPLEGL